MSSLTMPMRIRRLAGLAAGRFDRDARLRRGLRVGGDLGEEFGGLALVVAAEALGFAGQAHCRSAPCEAIDQRLGQARMGRHESAMLRESRDARGL